MGWWQSRTSPSFPAPLARKTLVRKTLAGLAEAMFPPSCPLCREETGTGRALCAACWPTLALLPPGGCQTCGRPIPGAAPDGLAGTELCDECLEHPKPWTAGRAVFRYEGAGRELVLSLKHADRMDLVPMLGEWSLRAADDLVRDADLIAPIPLHWTRRLKRRANQSAELARCIARLAGSRRAYAPRLLVRRRKTGSQDGRDRDGRIANLSDALVPGPDRRMAGARVLLVDDVLTTGATLAEATRVCLSAGAARVDILVLALVIREGSAYIRSPDQNDMDGELHGEDRHLYQPALRFLPHGQAPAGPEGRKL